MKKRALYPIASAVLALGVAVYTSIVLGKFTVATVFLVFATVSLTWVVWVSFQAARALTTEPEAQELAKATGRRKKELEREKQALLKALKELEFDHEMGKVSDADYQEIGGNYRARAVRVMRQLDAQAGEVDYRSLVERDLENRRKARPANENVSANAIANERPKCASCSTVNDPDAEFCKKCGKKMREEAAS